MDRAHFSEQVLTFQFWENSFYLKKNQNKLSKCETKQLDNKKLCFLILLKRIDNLLRNGFNFVSDSILHRRRKHHSTNSTLFQF